MHRTTLFFAFITFAALVTGCVTVESTGRPSGNAALVVPPDLTPPDITAALRVPTMPETPLSVQTKTAFDNFQFIQQQADYQAFLEWQNTHGSNQIVSLAAFREAKLEMRQARLHRDGILIALDEDGRKILLILDSLDGSWNRIDTALINLNVQLLSAQPSNRTFRISYKVGRNGGSDEGWRNWATQLTGRAIYELKLAEENDLVVASIFDCNGRPVISPSADTFIHRLAVQLKTFAGKQEQFVTGGTESIAGLGLRQQNDGRLQLVIPEHPIKAWNRVATAVRDSTFSVANREKETLALWIRYAEPGRKTRKNLLARLGLRKEKVEPVIEEYRVQLTQDGKNNVTLVTVWNSEDLPAAKNDEILTIIFEKLKS